MFFTSENSKTSLLLLFFLVQVVLLEHGSELCSEGFEADLFRRFGIELRNCIRILFLFHRSSSIFLNQPLQANLRRSLSSFLHRINHIMQFILRILGVNDAIMKFVALKISQINSLVFLNHFVWVILLKTGGKHLAYQRYMFYFYKRIQRLRHLSDQSKTNLRKSFTYTTFILGMNKKYINIEI